MVKILSLIGSRSTASNTAKLAEIVVSKLQEDNPDEVIQHELLQPEDWNLMPCLSCSNCFVNGFCVLDEKDGMKGLKEKIMDAQVIIMGSPVFAGNVSGDTKHLIDRLSMWLHVMPLIGKYGIVLSTTSNNSGNSVTGYLGNMAESMGLQIVLSLNAYVLFGEPLISDISKIIKLMESSMRVLYDALFKGIRPVVSNSMSERYALYNARFQKERKLVELSPELIAGELQLWEKQGYMQFGTIDELLDSFCHKIE